MLRESSRTSECLARLRRRRNDGGQESILEGRVFTVSESRRWINRPLLEAEALGLIEADQGLRSGASGIERPPIIQTSEVLHR